MSENDTMPTDFNARIQVLWQEVPRISEQLAALSRQSWIQEQEVLSLKFRIYALELRILRLEERKGLDSSQPRF